MDDPLRLQLHHVWVDPEARAGGAGCTYLVGTQLEWMSFVMVQLSRNRWYDGILKFIESIDDMGGTPIFMEHLY